MSRILSVAGVTAAAISAGSWLPMDRVDAAGVGAVGQEAAVPAVQRAIVDQYCVTCHNERLKTAGLMLDTVDLRQIGANAEVLEKVARKIRSGQMPPEGRPRPDRESLSRLVADLEAELDRAASATPNPGWIPSHRLNRSEYVNAIRDLLSLEIDGTELLPPDMAGFGFDNNADVLSITPGLMSRYMTAATKISRLAVGSLENRPIVHTHKAPPFGRQNLRMGEDLPFGTYGGLAVPHVFPLDGEYVFKLRLQKSRVIFGGIAENEYQIELRVDHALVKRFTVGGKYKGKVVRDEYVTIALPEDDLLGREVADYSVTADKDLEVRLVVKAGTHLVAAAFLGSAPTAFEGVLSPSASLKNSNSNQPGIDSLEIGGPFLGKRPQETASRKRIFICRPVREADEEPCARRVVSHLARGAFRRPVTAAETESLLAVYRIGRADGDFETGIERALEGLLTLPQFLLRLERPPAATKPGASYRVSDFELASRLSFFLWKSIPDDELMEVAAKGNLKDPVVLGRQVRRMMSDRRAGRWMADFVGQWLQIRNLKAAEPDPAIFPDFDDTLRDAMIRETELFFESQVQEDRSVLDLLRADYTFINQRLAEHYRIPKVYGSRFRRVVVPDPARRGLLGHASVLTATSYANRTSVVLRGKWVLETLLGAPPPPPPPNVPPLKENDGRSKPASLRARMEQHRNSPVCATCHAQMDPLGFALENYDATGRWRTTDDGAPIDATIAMDGMKVKGPEGFREAILRRQDEFLLTLTEKLLTYALGRGVQYYDAPMVRQIIGVSAPDNYRWSSLIVQIVTSAPFQMRKASEIVQPEAVARRD